MPSSPPLVRRYRAQDKDAVVTLLYDSSGGMYDRYAGTRAVAERALGTALERDGTGASPEVIWVAELDGEVAAAMAAMPAREWAERSKGFLRVLLRSQGPWRWPRTLLVHRASGQPGSVADSPSFYVDSLATSPPFQRRGAARALLRAAEDEARRRGLRAVSLDTWQHNREARALYVSEGFEEVAFTPAVSGLPGGVSLLKELR